MVRRSALNHTFGRLYENSIRQFGKIKKQYKRFLRDRSKQALEYFCSFRFKFNRSGRVRAFLGTS